MNENTGVWQKKGNRWVWQKKGNRCFDLYGLLIILSSNVKYKKHLLLILWILLTKEHKMKVSCKRSNLNRRAEQSTYYRLSELTNIFKNSGRKQLFCKLYIFKQCQTISYYSPLYTKAHGTSQLSVVNKMFSRI